MNQVNFLPDSFYRRKARRRRVVSQTLLVLVVAAGLGTWVYTTRGINDDLRRQLAQLQSVSATAQSNAQEAAGLKSRHALLTGQLKVQDEVGLPVTFSQILASIAAAAPQSIAVTDLQMSCPRPTPAAAPKEDDKKSKRQPARGNAAPAAAASAAIRIELSGISPSDERIADLIGHLSANPLFTQVKLEFSRAGEIEPLIVRRFRVTMQVPLDRDYRAATKEVAHAD